MKTKLSEENQTERNKSREEKKQRREFERDCDKFHKIFNTYDHKSTYDAKEEELNFNRQITKFEKLLTKAKRKNNIKREKKLRRELKFLAAKRCHQLSYRESNDYSTFEINIDFNDSNEAKINIEFIKLVEVLCSGEEVENFFANWGKKTSNNERSVEKQTDVSKKVEEKKAVVQKEREL